MKQLLLWLLAGLLSSCALGRDVPAATAGPALDSTLRAAGLSPGKVKFTGPVTLQLGGSGNTATSTSSGEAKAPVATAPQASAMEATRKSGPPWWVYAGLVALGLAGGFAARGKLKIPLPF